MNAQQLENLKKLRDNLPNKLISHRYYDRANQCFCVIGKALHDYELVSVDRLAAMPDHIIHYELHTESLQIIYGLDLSDIIDLQSENDWPWATEVERVKGVYAYLTKLIEKYEKEVEVN